VIQSSRPFKFLRVITTMDLPEVLVVRRLEVLFSW